MSLFFNTLLDDFTRIRPRLHDKIRYLLLEGTSINYKRVTTRGAIRLFIAVNGGTPLKFLIFSGLLDSELLDNIGFQVPPAILDNDYHLFNLLRSIRGSR